MVRREVLSLGRGGRYCCRIAEYNLGKQMLSWFARVGRTDGQLYERCRSLYPYTGLFEMGSCVLCRDVCTVVTFTEP